MARSTTKSAAEVRAANAAVMAKLRNPKIEAAPTKTTAPRAKVKATARVITPEEEMTTRMNELFGDAPSKVTQLIGSVAGLLAGASSMYWGLMLAEVCAMAVLNITGFVFLTWLTWFMLAVLAVIGAVMAAFEVGTYIGSGKAKHDVQRAKLWITGVFKRGQAAAAEAA
jgi:hypothetical protein